MNFYLPDRYKVVGKPLRGGMGVVYLCLDRKLQRPVVLKTFQAELLRNHDMRVAFLREASIWMDLPQHPHIVRAYSFEKMIHRQDFIVLEQVAQGRNRRNASLSTLMEPGRPLPVADALLYGIQISRGLQHAVATHPGLVHRDIKPGNILVGADRLPGWPVNRARVTDFGLVAVLQGAAQQAPSAELSVTSTQFINRICGTPQYMAAEQWHAGELCTATDIYAVGCVLFEMLTGTMAAAGESATVLRQAHCNGLLRGWSRSVPASVREVVGRCLRLDACERFQSWPELEAALAAQYQRVTGRWPPAPPGPSVVERGDQVAIGWAHHKLGEGFLDVAKPKDARSRYQRVLVIASKERDLELYIAGYSGLGKTSRDLGDLRGALLIFRKLVGLEAKSPDRHDLAGHLAEYALVCADLGKVRESIVKYQQALRIFRKEGDLENTSTVVHNLAYSLLSTGQRGEAMKCFREALRICRKIGDKAAEGRVLGGLGRAHRDSGELRKAIGYYEQSLQIARAIADRRSESQALGNLASAYLHLGDQISALDYSRKAIKVFRESGNQTGLMIELSNLGCVYAAQGKAVQSLGYFKESHALALANHSPRGEVHALGNIGCSHVDLGDARLGLRFIKQAFKIASKVELRHQLSAILLEQGNAELAIGRFSQAVVSYEAAFAKAKELRLREEEVNVLSALGAAHAALGEPLQALKNYKVALALAIKFENLPMQSQLLCNTGRAHVDLGNAVLGLTFLSQAHAIARRLDEPPRMAAILLELGRARLATGDFGQAIRACRKALAIVKKLERPPLAAEIHWALGLVHEAKGDLRRAAMAMQECVAFEREVRHHFLRKHETKFAALIRKLSLEA